MTDQFTHGYALLIGVSDYTAGWPDLQNIPRELDRVEETLKKKGFQVARIMNPDSRALTRKVPLVFPGAWMRWRECPG